MAAASSCPSSLHILSSRPPLQNRHLLQRLCFSSPSSTKLALSLHSNPLHLSVSSSHSIPSPFRTLAVASSPLETTGSKIFHGLCFVVEDNIDTDQIIPAEYLTLVPSKPDEYVKLGSYAMVGLPDKYPRFMEEGQTKSRYNIVIAGSNFGCGSSREHAPVCLGAAGVRAVVAESYARIFFRNSVSTGALYPLESEDDRLSKDAKTGDYLTVDMERNIVINHTQNGKQYSLKPVGDAGPVIDAGGLFAYARKTGMIGASAS